MKIAVFDTHPVQYRVPLWRELSKRKGLDLTVYYFSDSSIRGGMDTDFQRNITWDIPLLSGYKSIFLSRVTDPATPKSLKIENPSDLLLRGKYDCVLLLGYVNAFETQVLKTAKKIGLKIVMRTEFDEMRKRNIFKQFLRSIYLTRLYKSIDVFGVIGENARNHLRIHGVEEERMVDTPYTVDTDLFEQQRKKIKRSAARKQLGYKKNDFVVMFSGKFIPRKEPLLLLEAMTKAAKAPNLKLLMLGDGPLRSELLNMAESQLPGRVKFQGFINQSQLGRYYQAADLFVLPSNHETWGLVVNEAMQFGLPVIVSDRVGCRFDLLHPDRTGFVFPNQSINVLSQHIQAIFRNPLMGNVMGENGRDLVINEFTVQKTADGLMKAFEK